MPSCFVRVTLRSNDCNLSTVPSRLTKGNTEMPNDNSCRERDSLVSTRGSAGRDRSAKRGSSSDRADTNVTFSTTA